MSRCATTRMPGPQPLLLARSPPRIWITTYTSLVYTVFLYCVKQQVGRILQTVKTCETPGKQGRCSLENSNTVYGSAWCDSKLTADSSWVTVNAGTYEHPHSRVEGFAGNTACQY